MDCNHIIGTAESDENLQIVEEGDYPHGFDYHTFEPFSFCPKCGVSVAQHAADFQRSMDEFLEKQKADSAARPKSRIDMAFEEEAAKMICEISRSGVSRVSSLILKDQLPKEPDQP